MAELPTEVQSMRAHHNQFPAVFLDRDGTLIEDRGHLSELAEILVFDETVPALRALQEFFLLFIVTNQSGIGESKLDWHQVDRVNSWLLAHLEEKGIAIAAVYVCPHRRMDQCECIKPKPYFLWRASRDFGVDLSRSFVIGDHPHDVELARGVGARGVYVRTGHGMKHLDQATVGTPLANHIGDAARWILERARCEDYWLLNPSKSDCLSDSTSGG